MESTNLKESKKAPVELEQAVEKTRKVPREVFFFGAAPGETICHHLQQVSEVRLGRPVVNLDSDRIQRVSVRKAGVSSEGFTKVDISQVY